MKDPKIEARIDGELLCIRQFVMEHDMLPPVVQRYFHAGAGAALVSRDLHGELSGDSPHLRSLETALAALGEHAKRENLSPADVLRFFQMGQFAAAHLAELKPEDHGTARWMSDEEMREIEARAA